MRKIQENKKDGAEGVHVVYKKQGETPLEAITRLKDEQSKLSAASLTYAGRLDPMAEGLLLILSGDAILEKEKYLGLPKTYEVEMLWGFCTDTGDVLGMEQSCLRQDFLTHPGTHEEVRAKKNRSSDLFWWQKTLSKNKSAPDSIEIVKMMEKMKGTFLQKYPAYSSKPVFGKPLFEWAREGRLQEIEIPSHEVTLQDVEFLQRREVKGEKLLQNIEEKIKKVKGDFRQEEIVGKWKEVLKAVKEEICIVDSLRLSVSSGFYVRQFIQDIGLEYGIPATTYSIKRTRIGDFHIE